MKKMSLLFIVSSFFVLGCKENNEPLQREISTKLPRQDSVVQNSLYEESPLVGDVTEVCSTCSDPSEVIVHRSPFKAIKPHHKIVVLDSGAALSRGKVLQSVLDQTKFINGLYQKYLEQMQAEHGDSAYFAGKIALKLSINENGPVDDVVIVSSTTANSQFDQEIADSLSKWKFPKSEGKTVVTFPLEFIKTKYSRGDKEIVKTGI